MAFRDMAIFGALIFALGIGFLILRKTSVAMVTAVRSNAQINSSNASLTGFQAIMTTSSRLDGVFFAVFIGLLIGLVITAWLVAGNPIFMIFYIITGIVAVFLSFYLSNNYINILINYFGAEASNFPLMNNILTHLPVWSSIAFFIGFVVMFAKPSEERV
jgi:hypothetical protein